MYWAEIIYKNNVTRREEYNSLNEIYTLYDQISRFKRSNQRVSYITFGKDNNQTGKWTLKQGLTIT